MLNDMITVTPAFLGKLVITLKRYDSSTVISLACSRLQDSRESRSKNVERKPRRVRGAGRDGEVDLLVYPMIRQFWQFTSTLMSNIWLHARLGKQTWRAVKPSFTAHFASRNGFRFRAPGSRLCFLSFHPSPFSSASCPFRSLTFRHFRLRLLYLCCPIHPGSQNLRPSPPAKNVLF